MPSKDGTQRCRDHAEGAEEDIQCEDPKIAEVDQDAETNAILDLIKF
jgi:hypothetical protein